MGNIHTPQVIFLYGPAGCGKGTQAFQLLEHYPEYQYFEVGQVLRTFNSLYKDLSTQEGDIARRASKNMSEGQVVDFEDWKYIWNHMITPKIKNGDKLLFDGVFREYQQSFFLSNTIAEMKTTCALFIIHISSNEAIKRLSSRYYTRHSRRPYSSYEEAKEAGNGEEPIARTDDQDADIIRARYRNQYESEFGRCISLYQRVTAGELYIIDGEQSVDDVFLQIDQNLNNFSAKFTRITL